MSNPPSDRDRSRERLSRFWPILARHRVRMAAILALQASGILLGLASPFVMQLAIDRILIAREVRWLLPLTVALFVSSSVGVLLSGLSGYLHTWLATRVAVEMRFRLYRHLQRLPLAFYVRARVGDLQARMGSDLGEIQAFLTEAPIAVAGSILTLIGVIGLLLYYSPLLFAVSLLFAPAAGLLMRRFQRRLQEDARSIRDRNAELASQLQEGFLGVRFIRAYRLERREAGRFLNKNREIIGRVLRYQVLTTVASAVPGTLIALGTVVTFYLGARAVIDERMTLGALVAFGIYQVRLYGPVQGLFGMWLRWQRVKAALDRVGELLDEEAEPQRGGERPPLPPLRGAISFDRVSFSYRAGVPVLDGLSFAVEPGERVALVGASGAGKSTILDLLFGFQTPESGAIRVDGVPLAQVRIGSLREQIAVVSQDTFLFHATLRENLECGRRGVSAAEVDAAAEAAGVAAFAQAWPQGLETMVGERGTALSGGQRQRVSIARALLRRAPLLILDEATSQLDLEAENTLRAVLHQGSATLLAVTHRVDRLEAFDRVLELDAGRIVWEGSGLEWSARRAAAAPDRSGR